MSTVYVSIGNPDDKLTQAEWVQFCARVGALIDMASTDTYGCWVSYPDSAYQNACWGFQPKAAAVVGLKENLRFLATSYRQDSIAWAEAETEFLVPAILRD